MNNNPYKFLYDTRSSSSILQLTYMFVGQFMKHAGLQCRLPIAFDATMNEQCRLLSFLM